MKGGQFRFINGDMLFFKERDLDVDFVLDRSYTIFYCDYNRK